MRSLALSVFFSVIFYSFIVLSQTLLLSPTWQTTLGLSLIVGTGISLIMGVKN